MMSPGALRRVLGHLRGYTEKLTVELPKISREGKQHEDEMRAPSLDDLEAFRGMVMMARLVPGGLRCRANLQSFDIPSLVLFQNLVRWVEAVADRRGGPSAAGGPGRWGRILADNRGRLYPFRPRPSSRWGSRAAGGI